MMKTERINNFAQFELIIMENRKMQKINWWFLDLIIVLTICFTFLFAGQKAEKSASDKSLYTAYNIWYEPGKEAALWCINYKKGKMIPAGTKVTDVRITTAVSGKVLGGSPLAISFITEADDQQYLVNFAAKFHPGKTIRDYMEMMFSETSFEDNKEKFNAKEIEAIREGKLKVGMSKEAVIVCYGYPPEHRTPGIEADTWYYWLSRFHSKAIHFDEDGKTIRSPEKDPDEL